MARHSSESRVEVDGKFFRLSGTKFHVKGVTYGPFAPDEDGNTFASVEQTRRDFDQIRSLEANLIRTYYVPPRWFLDAAQEHSLKVFVDVPWPKHLCFLEDPVRRREARTAVREAVEECGRHPAVFAFSVVNEIPPDIVRWSGVRNVERFIDELVEVAKNQDPDSLCTFACYPPTEYLHPRNPDFHCYNVYLHQPATFDSYLARLQSLSGGKPLVLGELGMDSIRHGEGEKCAFLQSQIELAARNGFAGTILFSFTDDWHRGGMQIEDWAFGLTTRDRQPKESFAAVQRSHQAAPYFPLLLTPRVSVVVASYNGGKTLAICLESLQRLNYPDYEVILVDDGSTDDTSEIAHRFPSVKCIRQDNLGLSAARNAGIAAASGEIIAFTDSDCRADEDWLYYMVSALMRGDFAGVGGHNFLPPEDSPVAAAVMASPGGPAHVMLTDREAEHIPGCNMAFYKWALEALGGFDPVLRKAGDDVDVCWRLLEQGYRIGFSHAGFVWHHRRSNVRAYLKQQRGYGEAEALLSRKHPEYFSPLGGSIWRGRIYSDSQWGIVLRQPVIYHGIFCSGFFQKLYRPPVSFVPMLCSSLEYHVVVTVPLAILASIVPALWPLPVASLLISFGVCAVAAVQAELSPDKKRVWSRPLIALLFFLQPLERGLARYRTSLRLRSEVRTSPKRIPARSGVVPRQGEVVLWSRGDVDRFKLLARLKERLSGAHWQFREDTGWDLYDLEIQGDLWAWLQVATVHEDLEMGRRNIRCRFRTGWGTRITVTFWVLAAAELVLILSLAGMWPWAWMLLLTLPLVMLLIEHYEHRLTADVNALLGESAKELGLLTVQPKPE